MNNCPDSRLSRFSQTHWSAVLRASRGSAGEQRAAFDGLCHSYWMPLYIYLRGMGRTREDAEDLVQGFFSRLMDGRLLAGVDPAKGRFRTFMLASLRNLERDVRRGEQAEKRGGGVEMIPFDASLAEQPGRWNAGVGFPRRRRSTEPGPLLSSKARAAG